MIEGYHSIAIVKIADLGVRKVACRFNFDRFMIVEVSMNIAVGLIW